MLDWRKVVPRCFGPGVYFMLPQSDGWDWGDPFPADLEVVRCAGCEDCWQDPEAETGEAGA